MWSGWWLRREMRGYFDLLIAVQGYQIFVDGVFNGDPHPGNVMRLTDGRLGLIDYGNVKRFSVEQRARLGNLILALGIGEQGPIVAAATALGFRTRDGSREILVRYAQLWFDRDDPASIVLPDGSVPTNVQIYLERLNALDPLVQMPEGYLMAARNSFLLRGIGTHLGLRPRMSILWRSFAEQAVSRAASEETSSEL
mmetsp:Transcript_55599/g.100035  ORF Transcript_55599/g.100035 Transcript_55599/m.100035 type:complete len:197 (+) Transcript_55599:3-593(+)